MELLALVLEAKAQVPEEPVKVQEVDWTMVGVLMANVWNKTLLLLSCHAIPNEFPLIGPLVTVVTLIDCDVAKTIAPENVEPELNDS